MGMPGLAELIIIAAIGLFMIGIPVAIIALVIFLVRRSQSTQQSQHSQHVDERLDR